VRWVFAVGRALLVGGTLNIFCPCIVCIGAEVVFPNNKQLFDICASVATSVGGALLSIWVVLLGTFNL
jgi:hypothetical protein